MKIEYLQMKSTDLKEKLFSLFENQVFHLTSEEGLVGIMKNQLIKTNKEGSLPESTSCSQGSVGRKNDWVCLFDFRSIPESKKDHVFDSFSIPFSRERNFYLIFKPVIFEKIIVQESKYLKVGIGKVIKEGKLLETKGLFIHYGESWHAGDISIKYIERIIRIDLI